MAVEGKMKVRVVEIHKEDAHYGNKNAQGVFTTREDDPLDVSPSFKGEWKRGSLDDSDGNWWFFRAVKVEPAE